MIERHDCTPVALYARVSSDRQDVDLSVAAQLRALRDYAEKNGYLVAREFIDEAESGRIADRPEFRKMIDAASKPNGPLRGNPWSGSSPASPASASTPSPSSPCSGARASASSPSPSTPTTHRRASSWRPSSRAWTNSTARILLRRSREGCGKPRREASGFPATPLTATTGSWCRTVPKRGPPWRSTPMWLPPSSACTTWRRPETGRSKSSAPSTTRASPVPGGSSGPGPASTTSSPTRRTRAHWSGAQTPRTTPTRCGWRRRFPPSSPGRSCRASGSI